MRTQAELRWSPPEDDGGRPLQARGCRDCRGLEMGPLEGIEGHIGARYWRLFGEYLGI